VDSDVGIKRQPNRRQYVEALRRMTPEERLAKAFELGELTRSLLRSGLAERYPDASPEELHRLYLERLERCRSQTY
jgi:hypothetical protein